MVKAIAFTPEELGINPKELEWLLHHSNKLAIEHVEKGGPTDNASLMQLWFESFDTLIISDKAFRKLIMTLASIQIIQIQMQLHDETMSDRLDTVLKLAKELKDKINEKENESEKVLDKTSDQG